MKRLIIPVFIAFTLLASQASAQIDTHKHAAHKHHHHKHHHHKK